MLWNLETIRNHREEKNVSGTKEKISGQVSNADHHGIYCWFDNYCGKCR